MSLLDILNGRQPLLRSTSRRQNMRTIEQDYASLASKGGGPFYLNSQCNNTRFDRQDGDPTYAAIEPRGIGESGLGALMQDRDLVATRICFVNMAVLRLGGAKSDVPCSFPFPVNRIWVASKQSADLNNSLYVSLEPLNKYPPSGNPAGSSVDPSGTEHWFDLTYYTQGNAHLGKLLQLEHRVRLVYLTVGFESGGVTPNSLFTIGGSDGEVVSTFGGQSGIGQ